MFALFYQCQKKFDICFFFRQNYPQLVHISEHCATYTKDTTTSIQKKSLCHHHNKCHIECCARTKKNNKPSVYHCLEDTDKKAAFFGLWGVRFFPF